MKHIFTLKKVYTSIFVLTFLLTATSCSNQDGYEIIQGMQESECEKLIASEYDKCMASMKESYESYNQKRKEAIETKD